MEFFKEHVLPALMPLVATGLMTLIGWLLRKTHLTGELQTALTDLTKRCLDKGEDWAQIAMSPTSDGGVAITAAEVSKLRQLIWETAQEEIKGPIGKLLLAWGEERVKGFAGTILAKLGVKVSAGASPTGG